MSAQATDTTHTTLRAKGFSCPSCVAKIEGAVGKMPGVADVTVHFASGRIEVDHDESQTSTEDIVATVGKLGYTAKPSMF